MGDIQQQAAAEDAAFQMSDLKQTALVHSQIPEQVQVDCSGGGNDLVPEMTGNLFLTF